MSKLNKDAVEILKNFSSVNSNLVVRPGQPLKTMAEAKNIMGTCDVPMGTDMPDYEFGIYDLSEFLSVVGLFETPELDFSPTRKFVTIKEGKRAIKYYFSNVENLTSPTKDINMPETELKFEFKQEQMESLTKAAGVLDVTDVELYNGEAGELMARVTNLADATSNSYSIELASSLSDSVEYSMVFNIKNFRFVPGDYDVELSSKLIARFAHKTLPLVYFVALEKSSTYKEV